MPTAASITIAERYQIAGEPIGQGGMGIVYKAWDTVTRRYVAVKTMRGSLDSAALELFSKEWTVLSRLNHPNIVDLFDSGEYEEDRQKKPFFVMPFLPGRTFDYLIRNASQRLTVERVIEIMLQTCRGLHAAHEAGLIHRDLKPSNIFVMDDDTVKIIDFGVVHLAGSDTVTGIRGTLQYMAPEQVEMKPTSPASDIFSLAVVCYEALTGRKPFARKNETETMEALRRHIPPPVCELNPLVSQLVSRVVHKAMAKAPYHRFSTAREFAETLQKAVNNQPIERFDKSKTLPRLERARKAQAEGDLQFASELLSELEAEGHIDPDMTVLRLQINNGIRQKQIRQLLETARSRREEEEFPLALQKIQEVLEIDPDNADAISLRTDIERQRGDRQIENWFRLVAQHIHHQSFAQARQALEEILKLDTNNVRAHELLVDVGRREQELNRVRAEKEKLYQAALHSYENGEVSAALSKLEKVLEFSQTSPDSETSDRDAQYQGLYNQIRTERDAARNAYSEGRRYLAAKNFDRALEICAEFLKRYPADPLFQALKLEAEESRRQEHSSFLAEVVRRAESEPDLDRRVNILKEASERYPEEAHFAQSLRLTRERRDLVNAIVARARQYEERSQFGEALGQWDILRNIYAQYPGIDFEVERLTSRREHQVREEAKARWVQQIDGLRSTGEYARARDLVRSALAEFPDDRELGGLDRLTQQDLNRAQEAENLLQEGQKLCFERAYGEGLDSLRKAAALDSSNPVIRAALLNALVEQARSMLGQDWRAAEPLIQQALSIDGGHPLAKSLEGLVLEYKRKEIVEESISQARDLQASGDVAGALQEVEQALESFPNEIRLAQLRTTLRKCLPAPEEPKLARRPAPDARRNKPVDTKTTVPLSESPGNSEVSMLDRSIDRTVVFPGAPQNPAEPALSADSSASAAEPPAETKPRPGHTSGLLGFSRMQWAAIAAFPIVVTLAIVFRFFYKPAPPIQKAATRTDYAVNVYVDQTGINGTEFFLDGRKTPQLPIRYTPGDHTVEVRAPGYVTAAQTFTVVPGKGGPPIVNLSLTPELLRLHVASDLKGSQVSLDGAQAADSPDGSFANDRLSLSADHKLVLLQSGKEYLSFTFTGEPGKMAAITSPLKTSHLSLVVISNLGARSVVYTTNPALMLVLGSEPPQPIPAAGLEITKTNPAAEAVLVDHGKVRPLPLETSNAPTLTVLLNSDPDTATLQVELNVPDTEVVIKGGHNPRKLRGTTTTYQLPAGTYTLIASKSGYVSQERTIELKKGGLEKLPRIDLIPTPKKEFVPPPTVVVTTAFSIEGGTAGAEIFLDDQRIGATSASGAFAEKIAPGIHSITFRKAGYEDKEIRAIIFAPNQSVRFTDVEATLSPLGSLAFQILPENATVSYLRDGETQPHQAANGSTVSVKQGRYTVVAAASDRVSHAEKINVGPGKSEKVEWTLNPVAEPCVFDKAQWTATPDGWQVHKGATPAYICRSKGVIDLQIVHPRGILKRAVDWNVDFVDSKNYVSYHLDENHIERKVYVDGKEIKDAGAKHATQMSSGATWPMQLRIFSDRITIVAGGKILDQYERPDKTMQLGRVAFRNDVQLVVQH